MTMALNGIDISNWQNGLDPAQVPADFIIAKASEGGGYADPTFTGFIKGTIGAGRLAGSYHYARGGDPIAEADHYLAVVGEWVGVILLVLDWEGGGNTAWGNSDWVRRFVNRVHDRTGIWPLVYVQASAIGQIPADVRTTCPLWVAQYADNVATGYQQTPWNEGAYECAMRQYSSTGRLPGWAGDLDLDKFYGSRTDWERLAQGDNDMVTTQDIQAIAEAVWNFQQNGTRVRDRLQGIDKAANDIVKTVGDRVWSFKIKDVQARDRLYGLDGIQTPTLAKQVARLTATVAAQQAAIDKLAESLGADPDRIAQSIQDAVKAKLDKLDITITTGD